jgi:hypothetical protein
MGKSVNLLVRLQPTHVLQAAICCKVAIELVMANDSKGGELFLSMLDLFILIFEVASSNPEFYRPIITGIGN